MDLAHYIAAPSKIHPHARASGIEDHASATGTDLSRTAPILVFH